jgi:divalent metal cation (Fe/Co/Zn/Cd) transporter
VDAITAGRSEFLRQGQRLEYVTITWNSVEALVSVFAGIATGSVALVGFGLDSIIEVVSGTALLWRLHQDFDPSRRERVEQTTLRIVGWCFVALAAYIAVESASDLVQHREPESSMAGIAIAAAAVIVMPILSRAKRRVAAGIGSEAMHADSRQTDFCAYLSAILLGGLLLNTLFGLWWADSVAGLAMVPIIAREGLNGLKGQACCDGCRSH